MRDPWNRCDKCGRFISYKALEEGRAIHQMVTPDSDVSYERFETLCEEHYKEKIDKIKNLLGVD